MNDTAKGILELHSDILGYYEKTDDLVSDICHGELTFDEIGDAYKGLQRTGLDLRDRLAALPASTSMVLIAHRKFLRFVSGAVLEPIGLAVANHVLRMEGFSKKEYTAPQLERIRAEDAAAKITRVQKSLSGWEDDAEPFRQSVKDEGFALPLGDEPSKSSGTGSDGYIELEKYRVRELYGKAQGKPCMGETWLRNKLKSTATIPCRDVKQKTLRLCSIEHTRLLEAEAKYDQQKRR